MEAMAEQAEGGGYPGRGSVENSETIYNTDLET
jgi:hypothetical protein